jgi:hypothetical protein
MLTFCSCCSAMRLTDRCYRTSTVNVWLRLSPLPSCPSLQYRTVDILTFAGDCSYCGFSSARHLLDIVDWIGGNGASHTRGRPSVAILQQASPTLARVKGYLTGRRNCRWRRQRKIMCHYSLSSSTMLSMAILMLQVIPTPRASIPSL